MLFFGQKCVELSGGQTGVFFSLIAKASFSYCITFVWFCNVALWDISLYLIE